MGYIKSPEARIPRESDLPHEQNRVTIGLTKSPGGMDVIGMTLNGKDWILFETMNVIEANLARDQLKGIKVDSLFGLPLDWKESVNKKELVLQEEDKGRPLKQVGIYIPAERFDEVIASVTRIR